MPVAKLTRMVRLLALLVFSAVAAPAPALRSLDDFARHEMKEWQVPGLALAVVRDGQVEHLAAYGETVAAQPQPVTAHTVFGIGSVTKSMTVVLLQTLAAEGKLQWDRPVRDFVPEFRLKDPIVTAQATVRDLVAHRTGLPRHDNLWLRTPFTRPELFERLRYLDLNAGLRQRYQYNNLMYMAAGIVAERLGGESWEALLQKRIFAPLQLASANTSVKTLAPYAIERKLVLDAIGPAGSVNMNIGDFARYLRFLTGGGQLDGVRVLPETQWREMLQPQIPIPEPVYEDFGEQSYGMGFFLGQYAGRKVVFHTGTIGGYHAFLGFLPEDRMGVAVLMNRVERSLPKVLSAHIFDQLLGRPATDWGARYRELRKKQETPRKKVAPPGQPRPSREFAAFVGRYEDPAYGVMEVLPQQRVAWRGHEIPLEHAYDDVFTLKSGEAGILDGVQLQFLLSLSGEVEALRIPLEPALPPIVFPRRI